MITMKKNINFLIAVVLLFTAALTSCKKEYGNFNSPTIEDYLKNASKDQLNGLVTGTLSGMRINEGTYLDVVGVMGREMYRFSNADPRFVSELLGSETSTLNNTGFYITNPWSSRYRTIKNCNVLIDAATNSTLISDAERKAYLGFAKTLKAYELLLNLNLTYTNGVCIDVADPDNLGPILDYDASPEPHRRRRQPAVCRCRSRPALPLGRWRRHVAGAAVALRGQLLRPGADPRRGPAGLRPARPPVPLRRRRRNLDEAGIAHHRHAHGWHRGQRPARRDRRIDGRAAGVR